MKTFKSYLGLGVFRRAVKLIISWEGSEEDRKEANWVGENLSKYLSDGTEEEKEQANRLFEDLRKRQELSLSC